MGVGIHRSKIALYIYDKTFEDNDEDKIVDADFIERNMGFYEILDEWKNLINHDVVSELVELYMMSWNLSLTVLTQR